MGGGEHKRNGDARWMDEDLFAALPKTNRYHRQLETFAARFRLNAGDDDGADAGGVGDSPLRDFTRPVGPEDDGPRPWGRPAPPTLGSPHTEPGSGPSAT